jgi:UDP-N-acetylglucosamine acyltransferase
VTGVQTCALPILPQSEGVIHPTAVIHPSARLDPTVEVGPFVVIEAGVQIGPGCRLGPHGYFLGETIIGARNRFFAGCVIGEAPQDLKYDGAPTGLRIGNDNVFREHVTVHRATKPGEETRLGSHNYLMAHCHIAHNSTVGDHVIIANGVLLGGYAWIGDRAFLSGNCLVHQFVRVGALALMQGGSAISKDLPPYTVARGGNGMCGLNTVGLRRAGLSAAVRLELKQLYHLLFRGGAARREAIAEARQRFTSEPARNVIEFVATARRGLCTDTGRAGKGAGQPAEPVGEGAAGGP